MNQRLLLANATVVLPDRVAEQADVLLQDGLIVAINPAASGNAEIVDLQGCMLMPGMIDLHCDALEKEVEPRPNVHFPLDFACAQADKRNAAAGITTVFHALSFANHEFGVRNNTFAAEIAQAIHDWQAHALVDNRVHARYEVTDADAPRILAGLIDADSLHLLSFMDHTPGQGQFKDMAAYRQYHVGAYKKSEAEIDALLRRKQSGLEGITGRIQRLAKLALGKGIPLASHDDDSSERVETMAGFGVSISEFPVTLETAGAAKALKVATLFGAPNVLRGTSQSGSMRALDAVTAGVADCLCGDYSPAALLPAVLKLAEMNVCGLAEAVALVTRNPAQAAGLVDRGEIAVGKRADLIAVQNLGSLPQVERVWVHGKAVFSVDFDRVGKIAGFSIEQSRERLLIC